MRQASSDSHGRDTVMRLVDVTHTYPGPPAVEALRGVSLEVNAGEYVAVTGASGSGKSTLLNVLGLLDAISGGVYELGGVDTASLSTRERAALRGEHIGFVFQAFHLMPHRSLLENVAIAGMYRRTRAQRLARAAEALDMVGLSHRASFLPSQVSGGERQRAAIARALAGRPRVLLADEPTGNLDSVTAESVVALFEEMNRIGFTVVVVSHDAAVARRARRQVVVSDGQVGSSE
ncbi:MAG: ABC transporter ATP-binding protein [Bifidobacteriaceae bacterium]|nr:ABC transporter ATP-binding protein [Bifidobacteriaceae bacterium]